MGYSTEKNIIRDLIAYLVYNINGITEFSLVKLMYLIEVGYFIKYNRRITDIPYKFHYYGPYSEKIHDMALELDSDLIKISEIITQKGYEAVIYDPLKKDVDIKLPKDVKEVADSVILEFGGLGDKMNEELKKVVYSTLPLTRSKRGEKIDFNLLKPRYRKDPDLEIVKDKLAKRIIEIS